MCIAVKDPRLRYFVLQARVELLEDLLLAMERTRNLEVLRNRLQQLYIDYIEELRALRLRIDEASRRLVFGSNSFGVRKSSSEELPNTSR